MDRSHPKRLTSTDYTGKRRYFLTLCVADGQKPFNIAAVVDLVMRSFLRAMVDEGAAILAWCFMPDHVHLLVAGERDSSSLPRLVHRMKQYSGYDYKQRFGRRLWQRSYFDRTMCEDADVYFAVRYILNNPVRAGLVKSITEYPFLGTTMATVEEVAEDLAQYPPDW